MSLRVLVVVASVALVLGSPQGGSSDCLRFCPDPNKPHGNYVCCDRRGVCPPVRGQCPSYFADEGHPNPNKCEEDFECPRKEKCCNDTCLNHKTCKRPDPY